MKRILAVIAVLFVALATAPLAIAPAANAQPVTLPDGKYASWTEYLAGTWKWERQEPRQTMIMRFGRDGTFFFHNATTGLQHYGRYSVAADSFNVTIARSCTENGGNCQPRDPPIAGDYPFKAASANIFMSNSERWERVTAR